MVYYNKEKTPYIVTTKLRIYLVALMYFVTMVFCVGFILVINHYRIDNTYKDILVSQVRNLDNQIGWYLDTLKIKLDKHVAIMSKELALNMKEFKCINKNTIPSTDDNNNLIRIVHQQSYSEINIDSIIFEYDVTHNKYNIIADPPVTDRSKVYKDLRQYFDDYNAPRARQGLNVKLQIAPHTLQGKTEIIAINGTWYLMTTTGSGDTGIYILSAIEIYTKKLNNIVKTYTYTTLQNEIIIYPMIVDEYGHILHHSLWSGGNIHQSRYISEEFLDTKDRVTDYTSQGRVKSGINKASAHLPWILTMSYNKEDVMYKVVYYNMYPLLGLILSNVIMLIIFINKLDTGMALNHFKKYGVTCVCEGECIAERVHCKSLLLAYKKRISNIYEFFYDNIKHGSASTMSSTDTLSLLKEIDAELDKEIAKFDDPNAFRSIAASHLKK